MALVLYGSQAWSFAPSCHISRSRLRYCDASANFFGGLAKAIEGALEVAWPGRLELLQLSEDALKSSAEATALLGEQISIGDVDILNSMQTESGDILLQCSVSGSAGVTGVVNIRGCKDAEGAMEIELLHLRADSKFVDATPT